MSQKIFDSDLVTICKSKVTLTLKKREYTGMCISDLREVSSFRSVYIRFNDLFYFCSIVIPTLLSSVEARVKYLHPLLSSEQQFILLIIKYKGFTLLSLRFLGFNRHIFFVINNFFLLFMCFDFIWFKIFFIDHVMKKVVCVIFYVYFFKFITHFILSVQFFNLLLVT